VIHDQGAEVGQHRAGDVLHGRQHPQRHRGPVGAHEREGGQAGPFIAKEQRARAQRQDSQGDEREAGAGTRAEEAGDHREEVAEAGHQLRTPALCHHDDQRAEAEHQHDRGDRTPLEDARGAERSARRRRRSTPSEHGDDLHRAADRHVSARDPKAHGAEQRGEQVARCNAHRGIQIGPGPGRHRRRRRSAAARRQCGAASSRRDSARAWRPACATEPAWVPGRVDLRVSGAASPSVRNSRRFFFSSSVNGNGGGATCDGVGAAGIDAAGWIAGGTGWGGTGGACGSGTGAGAGVGASTCGGGGMGVGSGNRTPGTDDRLWGVGTLATAPGSKVASRALHVDFERAQSASLLGEQLADLFGG
jgi:hypothetical protein